jgi:hypothetical protein
MKNKKGNGEVCFKCGGKVALSTPLLKKDPMVTHCSLNRTCLTIRANGMGRWQQRVSSYQLCLEGLSNTLPHAFNSLNRKLPPMFPGRPEWPIKATVTKLKGLLLRSSLLH